MTEISSSQSLSPIPGVDPFWLKVRDAELARAGNGDYKPGIKGTEKQIRAAALEFQRRVPTNNGVTDLKPEAQCVLVATACKKFPNKFNVNNAMNVDDLVGMKPHFFLANDGSLYIIRMSDRQQRHAVCVSVLVGAMRDFADSVPRPLFSYVTNAIAKVNGGRTAPDAALRKIFPRQDTDEGPLQAPFIAEVDSKGKSIAGSLTFASRYMREPFADYFMYIHVYKKRQNGTFAAIAILWRRGRRGPLNDGEMAQFVDAQSFGTAELDEQSIDAFRQDYGHFPGVPPAVSLVKVPPTSIVVPRAELLRSAVYKGGNPVATPQVDHLGNTILDANGDQAFTFPAGPDLIVDLMELQDLLYCF